MPDETKKDDEIKIEFSALKNKLFKKQETDDLSLNLNKIASSLKKNAFWLIPLLCLVIAFSVSIYLRAIPAYLPVTEDWAESQIHGYYKNQIYLKIDQQYPSLPKQNKNALVDKEFQTFLKSNQALVKQQIEQTAQQIKFKFQDKNGSTYLIANDPYYWYAESRNYINYGQFGDDYNEKGERIFKLRGGRNGKSITQLKFHPWFQAEMYKIAHFFYPTISLITVSFYAPLIISLLSLIPIFFIGRRIAGNVGGFFAALLLAINPTLLSRTVAGSSDTDPYNIFFPLVIAWLVIESFENKDLWKKVVLSTLAGLFTGLFAIAWTGWYFIVNFIIYWAIGYLIYLAFIHRKALKEGLTKFIKTDQIKNTLIILLTYLASLSLFVIVLKGFKDLARVFLRPVQFIFLKEVGTKTIWPNVLTTVAEFNEVPLKNIIGQMGGTLLFLIAILGIILTLIKKDEEGRRDIKYLILLVIWFVATIYSFTKGVRFAILLVPAFAIAFGIAVGFIYQIINRWFSKEMHIGSKISKTIVILLFCVLLIPQVIQAEKAAKSNIPMVNDAWVDTLTKIKDNTTDAVITSWWDFGHIFYALSERRVTFDGADQGERIYWVGKTLLTSDENVSVGLIRMLNCGQEKPVHLLEKFFNSDTIKAVDVLNKMMELNNKNKAIQLLNDEGLNTQQIAEIIKVTYCDDLLDQFYIASEDMVGKAGVWGHFGSWDFKRASMYQTVSTNKTTGKEKLVKDYNLTEKEANEYYYQITTTPGDKWISPWPGYQGKVSCTKKGNKLECPLNFGQGATLKLEIDLTTMNASASTKEGLLYPNSITYATKTGVEEKKFKDNLLGVSVILLPESSQILVAHPLQAKSIFTQLFFFEGHGLKCFIPFDDQRQITGERILTWKIDWDCQQNNLKYFLSQEEINASHILLTTKNKNETAVLEQIKEIRKNLTASNFAEMAKKYSNDETTKNEGGSLGWFGKNVMIPEFERAAFALNKKEISEPVKTAYGYHLIIVWDKKLS